MVIALASADPVAHAVGASDDISRATDLVYRSVSEFCVSSVLDLWLCQILEADPVFHFVGASDDIRRATELAYRSVSEFGLSSVVGPLAVSSMGGAEDSMTLRDSGKCFDLQMQMH